MKYIFRFLIIVILYLSLQPVTAHAQSHPKTSVIFDTDMGPDYDDVGAIALLHAMADSGECIILATIASNQDPYVAATLNVLNTYFRRPGLPVGVVRGNAVRISASQKWDSILVARYPHRIQSNAEAADALFLYRKILAAAPNNSVTIVTVGFLTNMAHLLQSPPDSLSPLTGKELVARKVKRLVSMAARFDEEMGKFKEFNVVQDAPASQYTFNNWPSEIIFSGFEIGWQLHTGLPITRNSSISHSPVKDVFARCIPLSDQDKNGRMSWDETAVLVAVRGYEKYFTAVRGRMICNPDGSNGWDKTGKNHFYLVQKMPVPAMEQVLDQLIMHQPVH